MKKFGIRSSIPPDDPLAKPHLLGDDWAIFHWFETEAERDAALEEMSSQHRYNRLGDIPSQTLKRVERQSP